MISVMISWSEMFGTHEFAGKKSGQGWWWREVDVKEPRGKHLRKGERE